MATETHPEKRSWIFQAIPQYFDLNEALKHIRIFRWRIKQFKNEIRAGDDVFLWLAGSDGGVVARGTVVTDPLDMEDSQEELPFVKEADKDKDRLSAAVEINTVFGVPVQREDLKAHPVLSSISILKQSRGTNFALTEDEADSLDALCPRSELHGASLFEAFSLFHATPVEQLRVRIRRERAAQLREFLGDIDGITLDGFNREVWVLESATLLGGEDIRGALFDSSLLDNEFAVQVAVALDAGDLELHGNYVWRPGSTVYGSPLANVTDQEKLSHVKHALRLLNDPTLSPSEKVVQIESVPGFGFPTATGLVILLHPEEIAIMNKQTEGVFEKLRVNCKGFAAFQAAASQLRSELGADDYLELDWFLYQINQGMIEVADREQHEKMLRDIDCQIEASIEKSTAVNQTEKEQLVKSRIGQGQFRHNIQKLELSCRVSGVDDVRFLIASHIKPWRACDNVERLDGANGLFLSPNIDLLFDRGHISFEDDGTLLIASVVDEKTLRSLGVPSDMTNCGHFSSKQKRYLAYHRQHVFLGSNKSE
ncbi:EVE domain-containing protein [Blastopirellula sp. JC732]|uniref:EVE domain-containing protein n=1 Tax=Blastopirellula sediminis TaxID=2894196 RepID=A0A9X1MSU3_9BACT|nr:EVE domain-containing protein [Blastopirellula sediminis]MCC9604570.1 EVE domain-containing protein [Blastopirellula sediminis]MCC9632131.1 EVE domain-containing protein [Blastopirellula sediminis]